MAAHMACVRSSGRASHHTNPDEESSHAGDGGSEIPTGNELSAEMSIISLSPSEADGQVQEGPVDKSRGESSSDCRAQKRQTPNLLTNPLDRIETLADLEAHVDPDLTQLNVLSRLEQSWSELSQNFGRLLEHVQECSDQVVAASTDCLDSFKESIDVTCDKVDEETKALYNLITKCEELMTKLSIASTFHEEIKTLKKSVDTLENLYKSRPQQQREPISHTSR